MNRAAHAGSVRSLSPLLPFVICLLFRVILPCLSSSFPPSSHGFSSSWSSHPSSLSSCPFSSSCPVSSSFASPLPPCLAGRPTGLISLPPHLARPPAPLRRSLPLPPPLFPSFSSSFLTRCLVHLPAVVVSFIRPPSPLLPLLLVGLCCRASCSASSRAFPPGLASHLIRAPSSRSRPLLFLLLVSSSSSLFPLPPLRLAPRRSCHRDSSSLRLLQSSSSSPLPPLLLQSSSSSSLLPLLLQSSSSSLLPLLLQSSSSSLLLLLLLQSLSSPVLLVIPTFFRPISPNLVVVVASLLIVLVSGYRFTLVALSDGQ